MALTNPQTEQRRIGDIVAKEWDETFFTCREKVTLHAAQTIVPGDLLSWDGTDYVKYSSDVTTGDADAVALEYSTASVPATILALTSGPALVHSKYLSSTSAAAVAGLLRQAIHVRTSPTEFVMP